VRTMLRSVIATRYDLRVDRSGNLDRSHREGARCAKPPASERIRG
jgi:hypothetical protein